MSGDHGDDLDRRNVVVAAIGASVALVAATGLAKCQDPSWQFLTYRDPLSKEWIADGQIWDAASISSMSTVSGRGLRVVPQRLHGTQGCCSTGFFGQMPTTP